MCAGLWIVHLSMDEVGYLVIYGVRKRDGWGVWVRRGGRGNGIICACR